MYFFLSYKIVMFQVKEILAGDKQLAEEIEFDLRKLEEQQREEEERQRAEEERQKAEKKKQKAEELRQQRRGSILPDCVNSDAESRRKSLSSIKIIPPVLEQSSPSAEVDAVGKEVDAVGKEVDAVGKEVDAVGKEVDAVGKEVDAFGKEVVEEEPTEGDEGSMSNVSEDHEPSKRRCGFMASALENLSPNRPVSVKTNLLRTAVMNSCRKTTNRRNSVCASQDPTENQSGHNASTSERMASALTKNRRATIASHEVSQENLQANSEQNNDAIDKNADNLGNDESRVVNMAADKRWVSTPNRTIVNNITFINQTQNMSAIAPNSSNFDISQPTILIHLKSPEVYAKSDEFSRIRRSSKRSLQPEFKEKVPEKEKKKPSTGGLFESLENPFEESEGNSEVIQEKREEREKGKYAKGSKEQPKKRASADANPNVGKKSSKPHAKKKEK